MHLFVTWWRKRDRPIVTFEDLHRIAFCVDLCISPRPSVRLSTYSCEQNTGRIYWPIEIKFGINHFFGPRTNPLEIGDNRSKFRYSSHIYLRPIWSLLYPKCVVLAQMWWNFAHTTKLSLGISMSNLIEIGSDIAIAPIYIVHPICYFCPPQA